MLQNTNLPSAPEAMSSRSDSDLDGLPSGDRMEADFAIRNPLNQDVVIPDTGGAFDDGYGSATSVKSSTSESLLETGSPELQLPFETYRCPPVQTTRLPSENAIQRDIPDFAVLADSALTAMPEPKEDEKRPTSRTKKRRGAANEATKDESEDSDDKSIMLSDLSSDSCDTDDESYKPPGQRGQRHYDRRRKAKGHPRVQGKRTRRRSRRRSPQLWTFLLDALCDSQYNPSLIKWVDKRRGIFRLTNNKKLAQVWGHRAGKDPRKPMNYEKFSRAIRYYYKQLVILSVSGRLTYQFGPNARGWKERSRRSAAE